MTEVESSATGDQRGFRVGDVGGNVTVQAGGDIIAGNKITIIGAEVVKKRELKLASPYRGLNRFEALHKDLFFGRDELIGELASQLERDHVLLVLGASGSGKSSVVRAGLIPELSAKRGPEFRSLTLVPNRNPFESLRSSLIHAEFNPDDFGFLQQGSPAESAASLRALLERSGKWLIFIDQFEEVFTSCDDAVRSRFLAMLLAFVELKSPALELVMAMRADFLDRFGPFPQFAFLVNHQAHFVADMAEHQLREVIEQPAAGHGVVYEKGLVDEIIRDVLGQPGSLPLLQYTLNLLWEEEKGHHGGLDDQTINTVTYRNLGGVQGALQRRAEAIYESFGTGTKERNPRQEAARRVFLRLVDVAGHQGDGVARMVRRRAPLASFAAPAEQEVLKRLIDEKLLVSNSEREGGEPTVEVAHEALFHSWDRLRRWIDSGRQVLYTRNRLADDARRWQRLQADSSAAADEELLGGSRLSQALEMRARGDFEAVGCDLEAAESHFLDASAARREQLLQQERERQQRELEKERQLRELDAARAREAEQRARDAEAHARQQEESRRQLERRRRWLQLAAGVAAALALAAIWAAWLSRQNARRANLNEQAAKTNEAKARASEKSAQAMLREASLSDFATAQDYLPNGRWQEAIALLGRALRYDPNNRLARDAFWLGLAYGDRAGPAEPLLHLKPTLRGTPASLSARFTPDAKWIVSESDQRCEVWEAGSGRRVGPDLPDRTDVRNTCADPSGRRIAITYADQTTQIWDVATGQPMGRPLSHPEPISSLQFSSDGKKLLTSGLMTVQVWDVESGRPLGPAVSEGSILPSQFCLQDRHFVTWPLESAGQLWDAATGQPVGTRLEHPAGLTASAFSHDRRFLVTACADKEVRLWDCATSQLQKKFSGHETEVTAAALSQDGTLLVTGDGNGVVRIWSVATAQTIGQPFRTSSTILQVGFSPDGTRVYVLPSDGAVYFGDTGGRAIFGSPIRSPHGLFSASLDPTGSRLAAVAADRTLLISSTAIRPIRGIPLPLRQPVSHVEYHPAGGSLATVSGHDLRFWNTQRGDPVPPRIDLDAAPNRCAYSPDGTYFMVQTVKQVRIWKLPGGAVASQFECETPISVTAFSADSSRLITLAGGKAQVWEVATGRQKGTRRAENVYGVGLSDDGNKAYTAFRGTRNSRIEVWSVEAGELLGVPCETDGGQVETRFSPDGRQLVILTAGSGQFWDISTGKPAGAAFARNHSPDSRYAVRNPYYLMNEGSNTYVFTRRPEDTDGDQASEKVGPPFAPVHQKAFAPDSFRIFSSTEDGSSRIWEAASRDELPGGLAEVLSAYAAGARKNPNAAVAVVSIEERQACWQQLNAGLAPSSHWLFLARTYRALAPTTPVSPDFPLTMREAATRLIATGLESNLYEALLADPGHPLIQIALAALEKEPVRQAFLRDFGLSHLPDDAAICRLAAGILLEQQDPERAKQALSRAARLEPNHADLSALQARLTQL